MRESTRLHRLLPLLLTNRPHGRSPGGIGGKWAKQFGSGDLPPWARGLGFPPFGPPEGVRRDRGDVRLAVLGLLAERPMHGYQLIREIADRSAGEWRVSPGSVYPTLSALQDDGLVRSQEADGRRTFSVTESGRTEAARRATEFAALWDRLTPSAGDGRGELAGLLFKVGAAAMQVGAAGSEQQRERAAELLEETRRSLYRVLAEDDDDETQR